MMNKRKTLIALSLAAGMVIVGSNVPANPPTMNIVQADDSDDTSNSGISDALRNQLSPDDPQSVTASTIGQLTEFDSNHSIFLTDISGLNYGTNLKKINLSDSPVSDISPLSGLTKLESLNLNRISLANLSPLSGLSNLQTLSIDGNNVYDFSAITSLKSLKNVTLGTQTLNNNIIVLKDGQSTSLDLTKYKDSSATMFNVRGAQVANENAGFLSPGIDHTNPSDIKVDSSYLENSTADSPSVLETSFEERIKFAGMTDPVPVTIYVNQPYIYESRTSHYNVHNITLNYDEWHSQSGTDDLLDNSLKSAIDSKYVTGTTTNLTKDDLSELIVNGRKLKISHPVMTKPGTYTVTYNGSTTWLPVTAQVTLKGPDTPNTNNNSGSGTSNSSKPSKSSNHSDSSDDSDISSIDKLTLITKKSNSIPIYNQNGEKVSNQNLNKLTKFNVTQKNVVDGETYYEISDGNWIKSSDVRDYTKESGVLQTESNSNKFILDSNGIRLNRALKETTDWVYDGSAEFDGTKYYRVATDEWVSANDVVLYNKINGVVKANVQAQVYKDTGEKSNRALAKNSEFVTDKVSKSIDGETMYRVATDEWVKASDVTFE
ncbi:leucine-rich repeat domain-containing protein [Companilactobacillus sp. HBUAS59699]|uniref:leucine-rich repeat domain-containing protein n=1 Tax=Companilactobacillus sp. HBUAS59699 TaxID=3109358 RepID=UPI002FF3FAB4